MALLQTTRKHVAALCDEATGMESTFAALEHLYASLAAADTKRADDLALQESAHRRGRHQHYLQLQQDMDRQYEELQRNSVHARAAHAERSFQQDLDMYRQNQALSGSLAQQKGKRDTSARGIADVVLSVGDWGSAMVQEDDFFSDGEEPTKALHKQALSPDQEIADILEAGAIAAAPAGSNNNTAGAARTHGAKKAAPATEHQQPPRQSALSTVRRHSQEPPPGTDGDVVILEDEDFV
ncbi:hypothetical protein LPJ81_001554 [Coemansia sp. IMI 209127]|nr:hypothetical protein LPJ81_001554 [Coemansia sp. IMI 209127]